MSKSAFTSKSQLKGIDGSFNDPFRQPSMNLPTPPHDDGLPSIPRSTALPNLSNRLSPYSHRNYLPIPEADSRNLEVLNSISLTTGSVVNQINKLYQRSCDNANYLQDLRSLILQTPTAEANATQVTESLNQIQKILQEASSKDREQIVQVIKELNKGNSLEVRRELGNCLAHLKKGTLNIDNALQASLQKYWKELQYFNVSKDKLLSLEESIKLLSARLEETDTPSSTHWKEINAGFKEVGDELSENFQRKQEILSGLQNNVILRTNNRKPVGSDGSNSNFNGGEEQMDSKDQEEIQDYLNSLLSVHEKDGVLLQKFHNSYVQYQKLAIALSKYENFDADKLFQQMNLAKQSNETLLQTLTEQTDQLLSFKETMDSFKFILGPSMENQALQQGILAEQQDLVAQLRDIVLRSETLAENPSNMPGSCLPGASSNTADEFTEQLNLLKNEVARLSAICPSPNSGINASMLTNADNLEKENLLLVNNNAFKVDDRSVSSVALDDHNRQLQMNVEELEGKKADLTSKINRLDKDFVKLNTTYSLLTDQVKTKQLALQEIESRVIRLEERLNMLQKLSMQPAISSSSEFVPIESHPSSSAVVPIEEPKNSIIEKKRVPHNAARNSVNLEVTLPNSKKRFSSFSGSSSKLPVRPSTALTDKRKPSWSRRLAAAIGFSSGSPEKKHVITSSDAGHQRSKSRSFSSKM
ncbi:Mitosis inducer protein blt1 [Schizosaccharomyces pombe]